LSSELLQLWDDVFKAMSIPLGAMQHVSMQQPNWLCFWISTRLEYNKRPKGL
jgi:hypothetical protein